MKFNRPKGFIGSKPRNWIDNRLPRCPFCKTPSLWEFGMEMKFAIAYNRYHFRCPNCLAILSVPTPIVIGRISGLHSVIASKNLKIESIGSNSNLQHLEGAEYPLNILQEWAREIDEKRTKKIE